jgi:peroxiredoxin
MNTLPALGATAPALAGPTDDGTFDLSALLGHPVVVYFYPKDSTPACAQEARDFRDQAAAFAELGVSIVGVSKDPVKKHIRFRAAEQLPFPLLTDEAGLCEAWGVFGEKKMYGKTFLGIVRSTFLIDAEGRVRNVWSPVKVAGHVEAVLAAARAL